VLKILALVVAALAVYVIAGAPRRLTRKARP
jgi:hypothetical protein